MAAVVGDGVVASAGVGTTEAVATFVFSAFAMDGTVSFWPTLSVLVFVRLFARESSPTLMPSSFEIFQSESPFLTTYVRAAVADTGVVADAVGATVSCPGTEFGASEFAAPGPCGFGSDATWPMVN